jgi:hypothetical protein
MQIPKAKSQTAILKLLITNFKRQISNHLFLLDFRIEEKSALIPAPLHITRQVFFLSGFALAIIRNQFLFLSILFSKWLSYV